ncbi:hypothetical protein Tco_1142165 [Tanacetum coccineum]
MSYNNTINPRSDAKMHRGEIKERYKPAKMDAYKEYMENSRQVVVLMVQQQLVVPTQGMHKNIRAERVRRTRWKGPMRRGEGEVPMPAEGQNTKIVLKRKLASIEKTTPKDKPVKEKSVKKKSKKAKETYVDDPEQVHVATLLSVETMKTQNMKGVAEYDDAKPQIPPNAQLLLYFKKTCKLSRREALIQELSKVKGERSQTSIETHEVRDSLDSDRTLSSNRLDVIDEGDEDAASNFVVFLHGKQYDLTEKQKKTTTHTNIISPRTKSSQDNVLRYLNETTAPLLKDVGLPRITRTSGDYLTEPTRLDQRGSARVDSVLITPDEILTLEATSRGNHELTSFTLGAVEHPLDVLAQNLNLFINTGLYIALTKSVKQDKQAVPKDPCKNANLRKRAHNDQDPVENPKGEKRYKKSRFVGQSSSRNDHVTFEATNHETKPFTAGKIREHPRWFIGSPAKYTDYLWVTRSNAEDMFNEVVDTYPDLDEPEDREIVPNNSTLTLAKRIKRCLKVDKLNLSKMEEFRKNRYEFFGNRYMSKAEYEYNMDQMTIAMSDDMDWALDHSSLNKAMMFLNTAISSIFPPTNNQLRTSSNPRTQATVLNDKVTIQNFQGRRSQGYRVNTGKSQATGTRVINNVRDINANQPRVLREDVIGSSTRSWSCLIGRATRFISDRLGEMDDCDDTQLHTISNFKADHVEAFDSDCDDETTVSTIFMESLSHAGSINGDTVGTTYDSDILSEVPHYDTYHENDVLNYIVQETQYTEQLVSNNDSYDELTSDINVISYTDYMVTIENDAA